MNSLKTMTLVAVMAAVAYGVYASLHKKPDAEPPPGVTDIEPMAPTVEMSGPGASTMPTEATGAPQFLQGGPVGTVPTLPPGVAPPAAASPAGSDTLSYGQPSPLTVGASPLSSSAVTESTAAAAAANYPTTNSAAPGAPHEAATSSAGTSALPMSSASQNYPTTGFPEVKLPSEAAHGNKEGYAVIGDSEQGFSPLTPATAIGFDPAAGDLHQQFAAALQSARNQANAGRLTEAHLELSKWYDQPQLSITEQRQLIDLLDRLAGTVIYSHRHHMLEPAYEVRPGDTLESVAAQYQMPQTLLAKINGLNPQGPLQPRQQLKVLRGPFNAVVDLKQNRLTLFLQGRYAGRFPIGIGIDSIPSAGEFEVQSITENPSYPGGEQLAGGAEPASPFGRYWIDLGNQIGIHGTSDPRFVGRNDGRGCICLKDEDIEHIHDILSVGSKVLIRR